MSSKVNFRVIGMLEDGSLLLDNGFTMSGVDIEEIKHIEEVTGYEMPILVECPGIGYVFVSSVKSYYDIFYSAGQSLVNGFAAGISANSFKAAKEDLMKCGRFEEWVKK